MGMRRVSRQGQGTLEYIIVLVLILLGIIAASSRVKTAVQGNMLDAAKARMDSAALKAAALDQ